MKSNKAHFFILITDYYSSLNFPPLFMVAPKRDMDLLLIPHSLSWHSWVQFRNKTANLNIALNILLLSLYVLLPLTPNFHPILCKLSYSKISFKRRYFLGKNLREKSVNHAMKFHHLCLFIFIKQQYKSFLVYNRT